jgi:hypothetical protein
LSFATSLHAAIPELLRRQLKPTPRRTRHINYLAGRGIYPEREKHPFPRLMILNIRMPGKDGLEDIAQGE